MVTCALALLLTLLAGGAVAVAGEKGGAVAGKERPPCSDATTCQARNCTGSFGLAPARRYQIAMRRNTDVCSANVGALERATRIPRESALDRDARTPAGAPMNNPLFGSPLFLLRHAGSHAKDSGTRWLVASVLSYGKPVLVVLTRSEATEADPAPQPVTLWRVPPGDAGADWSDPAARASLSPLSKALRPEEASRTTPLTVQDRDDTLFRTLRISGWPNAATSPAPPNMLPALPPEWQIGLWQRDGHREVGAEINFARYDNSDYAIATGAAFDVFLVFKLHPDAPGEDTCYLNSDISQRQRRAYVPAR